MKPSTPFMRRHFMLLMVLAITAPVLLTSVLGASGKKPSPDQAMQLFSSPYSINFHGIINPAHSNAEQFSLKKTNKGNKIKAEDEREPSSRAKNRMNAGIYPIKDRIPDVDTPQVKAWMAEIDWSKVPDIPVATGLDDAPRFPKCPPDSLVDKASCWWSCDGCVAKSDIMTCPTQSNWGLTYDDGPSEETRDLMKFLQSKQLSATFFIVGSRVLEYPDILREQVAQGHHLGMHTWSHAGLTTLTNSQIVAEIRWTEKIIRDVTGLTMKYVRPPYGDTDNRVREILRQMGYSTVIWTIGWDTNDWRMLQHQVKEAEIVTTFSNALDNLALVKSSLGGPGGPITLEHDLTTETINLSKRLIPMAQARGLKPMSLAQCLSDQTPYQRGSTLGPEGATGTPNNGEPKGSEHGIPGMEEQDFGHRTSSVSKSDESPSSTMTTGPTTSMEEKSGADGGPVIKSDVGRMVPSFGWMGAAGVVVSYLVL
ncbi:chitin deacetylase [Podila verticillata]|nr:chitin deacetylase [Podila verticillata]